MSITSKQIYAIILMITLLASCSSGANNINNNSNSDTNSLSLYGKPVPYKGKFAGLYTPELLQKFILTDPMITQKLNGINTYGICNGIESISFSLCASNISALNNNPNFANLFTESGTNITNFVIIQAAKLGINYVQPYRITYNTSPDQSELVDKQIVSALVLIPQLAPGINLPDNKIKGVILYFHPTIFSKGGVPSDFDGNLTPNNVGSVITTNQTTAFITDANLAALYATNGYIVIAPDYLGQGVSYKVQHPYVMLPQLNAVSGLEALKASRDALIKLNINLPNPSKLYISSYSEGGAYALWASYLAQTSYKDYLTQNGFQLKLTIGVSGAYDLAATLKFGFDNVNNSARPAKNKWNTSPGLIRSANSPFKSPTLIKRARIFTAINLAAAKTSLAGYVLSTLAYYEPQIVELNATSPNFYRMQTCLDWRITDFSGSYPDSGSLRPDQALIRCPLNYDLKALYMQPGLTQDQIIDQSFAAAIPNPVGETQFLTANYDFKNLILHLLSGYANNSFSSFIRPDIMDKQQIQNIIREANIYSWKSQSPINLIFLNYDSIVPNINSLEACGNLPESADFPGYQPGYINGLKQLSPQGMVKCINFTNNGTKNLPPVFTQLKTVPLILDHMQAETVLQIIALNQIIADQEKF